MFSVFTLAVLLAVLLILSVASKWLLDVKSTSNQLLVVACDDFFENAEKVMRTPEELPDSVLTALDTMISIMNNTHGSMLALKLLKDSGKPTAHSKNGGLASDVEKMRPELQELFGKTAVAWLNYVSNRHVFYHLAIMMELKKGAARQHKTSLDERETSMSLLPKFVNHA